MTVRARKAPLRAVTADETAPSVTPMSVSQAAASGSHRDLLVAMRTRIAKAVGSDETSPRDLAALSKRLADIAKEIEALDLRAKEEGTDGVDAPDEAWSSEAL